MGLSLSLLASAYRPQSPAVSNPATPAPRVCLSFGGLLAQSLWTNGAPAQEVGMH